MMWPLLEWTMADTASANATPVEPSLASKIAAGALTTS